MPTLAAAPTCHAASDVAAVDAALDFFTMALLLLLMSLDFDNGNLGSK